MRRKILARVRHFGQCRASPCAFVIAMALTLGRSAKERISCLKSVMFSGAAAMENSLVVPQKIKHRITMGSSVSTSGYIPQIIKSRVSKRCLYTHVHSSFIHNSQEVEAAQVSIDG